MDRTHSLVIAAVLGSLSYAHLAAAEDVSAAPRGPSSTGPTLGSPSAVASPGVPLDRAVPSAEVRIMPFGDSIT